MSEVRHQYSRSTHFRHRLETLQNRSSKQVPDEVIEYVKTNSKEETKLSVYKIIQILRLSEEHWKWIDSAPIIEQLLNGGEIPMLTREETDNAMRRFKEIVGDDDKRIDFTGLANSLIAEQLLKRSQDTYKTE